MKRTTGLPKGSNPYGNRATIVLGIGRVADEDVYSLNNHSEGFGFELTQGGYVEEYEVYQDESSLESRMKGNFHVRFGKGSC